MENTGERERHRIYFEKEFTYDLDMESGTMTIIEMGDLSLI